ncbi:cysteine hydrolase [[Mycobacterium] nativiensis]|uniref:Cysteine hydrolase n=1 Tax=[Mycobacterium] nativiensis TaxID=2855503 RepID=A0ABU5Y1V5_9MYCO|nr:cysteine hydrolase [Mycolicibacter sp. MYC340]MEB3034042.1 cysteine hydrolase [Mycolicibacter sp. MYC340]
MRSRPAWRTWPRRIRFEQWSLAQTRLAWIGGHQRVAKEFCPGTAAESGWIDPKQCALVALDLQPEILGSLENPSTLILSVNSAVDTVRRHGGHICFVRTAFDDLDYRFVPSTSKEFSKVVREHRFQNGTLATSLHPGLAAESDDPVVRKTRLGAFSTTDLDERLTNLGITTLILAGIHTSGAILSTVREASDRDYRLLVLSDCVLDTDRDAHHLLIDRILPRQAEIVTAGDLHSRLASSPLHHEANSRSGN